MECNKEEAVRALQVAEKKLHANDFMGARKMAQLAQRIYPELENVNRLLAIAEVLYSAEKKISDLKYDLYGILQIQQTADQETIRKQYRKLALLLHPDKNKFIGAEAAFKLIGEANRLLTDNSKRSLYDMKLRESQKTDSHKLPQQQSKAKKPTKKQKKASNTSQNSSHSQSSGVNTTNLQAFWTACSFCNMRFQYLRAYVSRMLRCQSCGKGFIAHDLGYHNVLHGSSMGSAPTPNIPSYPVPSGVPLQTNENNTYVEIRDKRAEANDALKTSKTSEIGSDSRAEKIQKCMNVDMRGSKVGENSSSGEAKSLGQGALQEEVEKKKRKSVVESNSGDLSWKSEVKFSKSIRKSCGVYQENGVDSSAKNAEVTGDRYDKKSSSVEQHYFDKENSTNDFSSQKMSEVNISRGSKAEIRDLAGNIGMSKANNFSAHANVDRDSEEIEHQSPTVAKVSVVDKKRKSGESKAMAGTPVSDQSPTKTRNVDCDTSSKDEKNNTIYAPQPDFSDFDKDRGENLFAANQIWVVYDTNDSMPRFYCLIKKVLSPGFKLMITWLEPNPVNKKEIGWSDEELPVACGKFRLGQTQVTSDILMFSHVKHNIWRSGRSSYTIHPSKGETWALFKNWNFGWSSNRTTRPQHYKYEFVEVLSDFDEHVGLEVACLYKVTSFVSLFECPKVSASHSFKISPDELYRFSHQVPSYVMTGKERYGIPKGSFELDTAGLPPDLFDHDSASEVKLESSGVASKTSSLP